MTASEPSGISWVIHRALGGKADPPSAEAWLRQLPALEASRLTALAAYLLRPELPTLPHDLRVHLEAASLMGESVAERGRVQLAEAAGLLAGLEIPWVVLKGWALAARLYPSPACRPSGDLDLLVRERDIRVASGELERAGYRVEGADRSYHIRLLREQPGQGVNVIELHHRAGPPQLGGPDTDRVLAARRDFESAAGRLWFPSREDELDLLIRHYLRHAGYQAILLLDVLKLADGLRQSHPLGALVGNDLARLGLERTIDGPARWSQAILARWMGRRSFEQRRAERHAALVGIPLALGASPGATITSLARLIWPRRPTPRWVEASRSPTGRYTWRWRRLVRMGR